MILFWSLRSQTLPKTEEKSKKSTKIQTLDSDEPRVRSKCNAYEIRSFRGTDQANFLTIWHGLQPVRHGQAILSAIHDQIIDYLGNNLKKYGVKDRNVDKKQKTALF